VVNNNGEIVLRFQCARLCFRDSLERSSAGYYRSTGRHSRPPGDPARPVSARAAIFAACSADSGGNWLTAAWPVPTASGAYRGEIQIHYEQRPSSLTSFLLTSSLVTSFLAAFGIALLFIGILSRNITRPIRLLSNAADQVSRGDLSVRVVIPGINDQASLKGDSALVTDDLTVLVNTVNTMIEKLENQERDRKDFISSISHDLRTPITSISGFVEGMLDGTVPANRYQHYLGIVKQEALRLQTLVNTMFEANILAGERKIVPTVFDINEVIKEDVIGLEALLAEKRLGVQTDFLADDQGRLLAIGDREAINRVVYNIMSNAIRFTPADGIIALTTRRSGRPKEIEVIIEDSGPGIPENEYPYIFDRFYKIDKSRTAKGSGLGLHICRTILAAHGQRITVGRSDLGGARFTFTLSVP
jgi:signal transduction histidine kinase